MEFVAHRGGNDLAALRGASGRVDLVELDVHLAGRRRLEVRHAKRLWPTGRLWDRWYLLPTDTDAVSLADVVAADPDVVLWLDLKGPRRRLGALAMAATAARRPITVSSKAWWLLSGITGIEGVRTLRSAGNRLELWALLRVPSRSAVDGAVVHRRLLDDPTIARLRARGPLFTWGVADADTVDWLRSRGVDGVIVDDLSLVPPRRTRGPACEPRGDAVGDDEADHRDR